MPRAISTRTQKCRVLTDGRRRKMAGGDLLKLKPGESVTLEPDTWHAFWGEGGRVLIGEVSNVNDDRTDNIFREPIGRFAEIEEDEAPLHLSGFRLRQVAWLTRPHGDIR